MEAGINSVMLKLEEGVDMKTVSDGNLPENGIFSSLLELTSGFPDLVYGALHVRIRILNDTALASR